MYNYNPYMQQNPMQMPSYGVQPQRCEIIKVNGENGARAMQMAQNSSALLLDETAPIVWLVQTDGAGYKTVTPYEIKPYAPQPAPDWGTLEERIKRLEERLNGQSNTVPADGK